MSMVNFHFTNAQYGYKITIPFYAGHINNYNNKRSFSLKDYNYPVQVYENLDITWYNKIHKYSYEEVLNAKRIIDMYTCDENNKITLRVLYQVYNAEVVGLTNNQGYMIELTFRYNNDVSQIGGSYLTMGMAYPNPSPISTVYAVSNFGPISILYDIENKILFTLPIQYNKIIRYENLIGKEYGDISTTTVDKLYPRSKGSYEYMSSAQAFENAGIKGNRITNADIGKQYINVVNNGGNIDNSIAQGWYGGYRCFFDESGITPPTYPNQNPDGDNDNGQSPSDPPIPGDGDTSSDPIPDPPAKPTFDVTNTGFVVIYNPSVTEIRQLAYFMWSGEFVDLIKKMFASPFEAIISLKMLFCPITSGSAQTVWLGNVETDVTMAKVTDQFTDVDLGTINVNEFFGSFADYAPFTKIQIYLPFIGFKDLNVDEVMNSQLHLRYRVDVYTGACIAYLTVTKTIKSTNLDSILYQFDGNCAMEIPFTSNDNSRYVSAIMNSIASSALSLANTSGYTMPVTGKGFNQKAIPSTFELGSLAPVANGMLDIMSAKPNVQRAGSLSGAVSAMALKQPYIIIHRPIAQMPADYQKYLGIPLNLTRQLANVTGYTIVSQVFMSSELATDREIAMITEALKNGVIL